MNYERHAYWCTHKSHDNDAVPLRVFIAPEDEIPRCPISGHGRMKRQENHRYFGQPVKDAPTPEAA